MRILRDWTRRLVSCCRFTIRNRKSSVQIFLCESVFLGLDIKLSGTKDSDRRDLNLKRERQRSVNTHHHGRVSTSKLPLLRPKILRSYVSAACCIKTYSHIAGIAAPGCSTSNIYGRDITRVDSPAGAATRGWSVFRPSSHHPQARDNISRLSQPPSEL